MNREREIQIIAEEICTQVPGAMLSRTDGTLYLEPADCRTIAVRIVNRLESHRRGRGAPGILLDRCPEGRVGDHRMVRVDHDLHDLAAGAQFLDAEG